MRLSPVRVCTAALPGKQLFFELCAEALAEGVLWAETPRSVPEVTYDASGAVARSSSTLCQKSSGAHCAALTVKFAEQTKLPPV